jgi:hypothetical protein
MRREKQQNNNLNHILNTCKDGNGGTTTNILQQLQSVTEQRVERWNKYQEILDEIGKKCNRRIDVRLARNVYTPSMAGQPQRMLKFMESLSNVQLEMTEERKRQQS